MSDDTGYGNKQDDKKKKKRKPTPSMLGSGMASDAAKAALRRNAILAEIAKLTK